MKGLRKLPVILFAIGCFVSAESQNAIRRDSLAKIFAGLKEDQAKVDRIISCLNEQEIPDDYSLAFAEQAVALSEKLNYLSGQIDARGFLIYYYLNIKQDSKKALKEAVVTLDLTRSAKQPRNEILALKSIAGIYENENQYDDAKRYLLQAKIIADKTDDLTMKFALDLDYARNFNQKGGEANLDSAIFYCKSNLNLLDNIPPDHELATEAPLSTLRAFVEHDLGIYYLNKKNIAQASKYIHSSAAGLKDANGIFNDSISRSVSRDALGLLYSVQNNIDSALLYLDGKKPLNSFPGSFLYTDKKQVSELYFKKGNIKKAYELLARSWDIKDSIVGLENAKMLKDLLVRYKTSEKEKEIVELNKNAALYDANMQRAKAINVAFFVIFLIIVLVTFFVWYFYKSRRKRELLLAEKNQMFALLEGQEKERERIASDLHDRLGSMLATTKLYFNAIDENIENIKKVNRDYYLKANDLLDEACVEVRKISHDLASGSLQKLGLVEALRELKNTVTKSDKIEMELTVFGIQERLPLEIEVSIYRIVQEMLSNTLKHAKAKKLSIQLNKTQGNLNLLFEDDGIGIDKNNDEVKDGIGMKNIRERIAKLNGRFEIDSGKKGTIFIVDIPLSNV